MPYCPKCGELVSESDVFCGRCGARLGTEPGDLEREERAAVKTPEAKDTATQVVSAKIPKTKEESGKIQRQLKTEVAVKTKPPTATARVSKSIITAQSAIPAEIPKVLLTKKPTAAGILNILAGMIELIIGFNLSLFEENPFGWFLALVGIIAVVSGVYAIRRDVWGFTIAGAICSLVAFPLGIAAIILLVRSRGEFKPLPCGPTAIKAPLLSTTLGKGETKVVPAKKEPVVKRTTAKKSAESRYFTDSKEQTKVVPVKVEPVVKRRPAKKSAESRYLTDSKEETKVVPAKIEPVVKRRTAKKSAKSLYFTEKNNVGTRQSTWDQANAYWSIRNMRQKFDPFVLYVFDDEDNARTALLELDCIHQAEDTGNIICTEPLIFGYYQTESGRYESIMAGENLTHELWQKAKASFKKHGGQRRNDQEPEKLSAPKTKKVESLAGKVKFVRKYTHGEGVYETYKCDDAELAKEFLMTKSVDKQKYYLTVETTMGNWGMDIKGLYKEHLLSWQTDIASGEVVGLALGLPDSFSLEVAARGINDNFVVGVKCGHCEHQWVEGLRYQDWTVVQCPKCQKRNKIHSDSYHAYFVK